MTLAHIEKQQQLLSRWSEALNTPACRSHRITLDHLSNALEPASQRSFQRLIQALFREDLINPDDCEYDEHNHCWLPLENGAHLCFNLLAWLKGSNALENPTSLLEQWGTPGHPRHPNYKTKLGLSASQVIAFSPEFEAKFPIVLCALHRQYAHVESLTGTPDYWDWWQGNFPKAAEQLPYASAALGIRWVRASTAMQPTVFSTNTHQN